MPRLEDFTSVNGLHHGWRPAEGSAPTLLFANSLGTDLRVWDRVVARIPSNWGVLRFDKRGHGLSRLQAGLSIETMTDDAEFLLDHYGVTFFSGIGLSVGGLIMQRLALRRPTAMTHLVLADTAAKIGSDDLWTPRIETVLTKGIGAISGAILTRWFAPDYQNTPDFSMWHLMLERTPAEGYAAVCGAIRDADYRADLAQISQPTLVVVGAQDSSTPPALVQETARQIPRARFAEIADAGHLPCVEQPDRFAALLIEHLSKI